jgi:mono/diheme cytochrome c family protein
MKRLVYAVVASAVLGAGVTAQQAAPRRAAGTPPVKLASSHPTGLASEAQNQLVAQYCATCHSDRGKAGGLTLAAFDAAKIDKNADTAEKMIRKLRAGMMPPPGAKRPDAATVAAFVDALENRIDTAAAANPNPGWRPFQRLNRRE